VWNNREMSRKFREMVKNLKFARKCGTLANLRKLRDFWRFTEKKCGTLANLRKLRDGV
jgi:hypothetical protein